MRFVHLTVFALLSSALSASAQDIPGDEVMVDVNGERARLIACFEDVMMPAKYLVEHVLVTPEKRQYVQRRNGTIELVEYPAVYRQERTLLEPAHRVFRQIPCKKKSFFGF